MGCWCYESKANAAVKEKRKLTEEKTLYVNVKNEVSALKGPLESYAGFFSQLGSALEEVIVNGKAFDEGKCTETASSIRTQAGKLDSICGAIELAITEIDDEISAQEKIINDRWKTCWYCAQKEKEAEEK